MFYARCWLDSGLEHREQASCEYGAKFTNWASNLAQWLKVSPTTPSDLSLVPRSHMEEERTDSCNL